MASLLLGIFLLQLVTYLIGNIPALNDYIYDLLPSKNSRTIHEHRKQLYSLKRQLANTSAQDDFARWARIRRQHDKLETTYNSLQASAQASRSKFSATVSVVKFLLTNVLRWVVLWYYGKESLFWIPRGWVPGAVEWLLAFPKAETGSVGVNAWALACMGVIKMAGEVVTAVYNLLVTEKEGKLSEKEPMAFTASPGKVQASSKKEL